MSDDQQPRLRTDRIRTGVAGEFLVAGEISKRGWIATLTAKNTPDVDVLAAQPEGDSYARIQVKTRTPAYKYAFRVAKVRLTGERDFFVFVDLGGVDERPRYYVVPAAEVARLIKSEQVRTNDLAEYEDRWDLLDGPA
jgi:hypothetical protein